MSHALEQINAARIGVICKSASSAPHFLLARLQGYSFQFVFQLVFLPYTLQLPSICVLRTAFKKSCSSKRGLLTPTTWDFLDISRLITPVVPSFSTGKLESTYLTPARAKVRTSSARNVMHLEQIIMSSRMSAPGISCSKEAVLCIGFMFDHHRNY